MKALEIIYEDFAISSAFCCCWRCFKSFLDILFDYFLHYASPIWPLDVVCHRCQRVALLENIANAGVGVVGGGVNVTVDYFVVKVRVQHLSIR